MTDKPIQITVIEDLKEVAISLQSIINTQEDMYCGHIYHNAEEAMNFIPHQKTDIVIVDIGLPRASGIEAIQYIRDKCPHILFCMFTVYEDDEKIFNSIQAGAKGYILKGASRDKIIESIRELYSGGSPMTPSIARRIIEIFSQSGRTQPKKETLPVTEREHELLVLLSRGLLYKEIAEELGITVGTVKQHIHKIYDKLQVNNKTEAINKLNNRG